jgi:hypothetical protein
MILKLGSIRPLKNSPQPLLLPIRNRSADVLRLQVTAWLPNQCPVDMQLQRGPIIGCVKMRSGIERELRVAERPEVAAGKNIPTGTIVIELA